MGEKSARDRGLILSACIQITFPVRRELFLSALCVLVNKSQSNGKKKANSMPKMKWKKQQQKQRVCVWKHVAIATVIVGTLMLKTLHNTNYRFVSPKILSSAITKVK